MKRVIESLIATVGFFFALYAISLTLVFPAELSKDVLAIILFTTVLFSFFVFIETEKFHENS